MSNHNYIPVISIVSLMIILGAGTLLFSYGMNEESLRILIRWTAKLAAVSFALAFGATGMHRIFKSNWTANLLTYRAHLGLTFGTFHSFHLAALIWLQQEIHPVFTLADTISLAGGGLAYLFMYLMAFTTFPRIKNKISPANWKWLHLIGGYWIWFIFFRSYLKNVINRQQYHLLLLLLIFVFIARMVDLYQKKFIKTSQKD